MRDGTAAGVIERVQPDAVAEIKWSTGARCAVPLDWLDFVDFRSSELRFVADAPEPGKTKRCSRCKRVLPLSEFYRHRPTRDGYTPRCRNCLRAATGQQKRGSPSHREASREIWIDRNGEPWTEARVIAVLLRDTRRRGRAPTYKEWARAGSNRPTKYVVEQLFGSWSEGLIAAGIPPELRKHYRAKKRCRHGHPLSGDNLYVMPDGGRACIACRRRAGREYARKKAEREAKQ